MIDIISLVVAINLIGYSLYLFFVKSKRHDIRNIFAFITIAMSLSLLEASNMHSGSYVKLHCLINFSLIFSSMVGPLFYHYVMLVLGHDIKFGKKHIFPAIIFLGFFLLLQSQDIEIKMAYMQKNDGMIATWKLISDLIFNLISIGYFIATYREVRHFKHRWESNFSTPDRLNLDRLSHVILGIIVSMVVIILLIAFGFNKHELESSAIIMLSLLYLIILIKTIITPEFLYNFDIIDSSSWVDIDNTVESNDPKKLSENVYISLQNYVDETQIFLTPKLSLDDLADKMDTKKYILSKAINGCGGQNFFTFINEYRVEEAKRRLCDSKYKDMHIEEVGMTCGFNSASSFFLVFKRFEGITPAQFKRRHKA